MKKVLVVAAHADDEALGCGATLAAHTDDGDEVAALFMTNGVGSRPSAGTGDIQKRRIAMKQAMDILGVRRHQLQDFPDNALDTVPLLAIVKAIESFCRDWGQPHIVYTHYHGDLNVDHQLAHRATMTCFRPQAQTATHPSMILSFEVLSSTGWLGSAAAVGFQPNYFRDITKTLERKLEALRAYAQEMRPWPHARSLKAVEHLARYRGASVGLDAAEGFMVERIVS